MSAPPDPFDLLRQYLDAQFEAVNLRIDDKSEELSRRVDEVNAVLRGNGQPGLVVMVDRHEQQLKQIESGDHSAAARHGGMWGAATAFVAAVAITVLNHFGIKIQ